MDAMRKCGIHSSIPQEHQLILEVRGTRTWNDFCKEFQETWKDPHDVNAEMILSFVNYTCCSPTYYFLESATTYNINGVTVSNNPATKKVNFH
jgi:hypothetical protein